MVKRLTGFLRNIVAKSLDLFIDLVHFSVTVLNAVFKAIIVIFLAVSISILAPKMHGALLRKYVSPKVVLITNVNPSLPNNGVGGGTGYYIVAPSGKTYIMTNRHVCNIVNGDNVFVTNSNKVTRLNRILERDTSTDLCLIESQSDIVGLNLVSKAPNVGEDIATVGHPSLQPTTITKGEIVGQDNADIYVGRIGTELSKSECLIYKNRKIIAVPGKSDGSILDIVSPPAEFCMEFVDSTITTAPIWHGSSGSPVVNFWGKVVGTMFAIGSEGFWGRFVPVGYINKLLEKR